MLDNQALNTRITLSFVFFGIIFLVGVVGHIYRTRYKLGISCCGSNVCAVQHHH